MGVGEFECAIASVQFKGIVHAKCFPPFDTHHYVDGGFRVEFRRQNNCVQMTWQSNFTENSECSLLARSHAHVSAHKISESVTKLKSFAMFLFPMYCRV